MGQASDIIKRIGRVAAEAAAETLWPTRCALCDLPGSVLCVDCAARLDFIDWWKACHRCGSAFGAVQCDLCNPVMLDRIGRKELPFSGCACATAFTEDTGQIVRVYKDQGERRLAGVMATFMENCIVPDWCFDAVTFVPASLAAMRYRGFDHAELLAREVASRIGSPCACTIERPSTKDQRKLGGRQRIENLSDRFRARPDITRGARLLLVDDVFTTGATMCSATDALIAAGAQAVYGLTFARV